MPITLNSGGWKPKAAGRTRGQSDGVAPDDLKGLPPEFLTDESRVEDGDEIVLEPSAAATRGGATSSGLDLSYDLEAGQTAVLAVRHASGALTFHLPTQSTSRGARGPSQVRFQVDVPYQPATTRGGIISQAIKAIVVKVGKVAIDKAVSFVLPKLAEAFERASWQKRGLREGWLTVTADGLNAKALPPAKPVSPKRSLLFIHGTFSNTASGFGALAKTGFFERVKDTYDDRIFGFDHFTLSKTPEDNARMLLDALPDQTTTFDVITHSRGGLVLRNLVERATQFGALARRFKLGRAVLVASPNDGTPLATPKRWQDTIGWFANILELFPIDNPFITGPEFVANGIVWLANHAAGDLPGLRSMDGDGAMIAAIQGPPGPPADAYSALVANFRPGGTMLRRLLDAGFESFFGSANDLVVPSEGGWRIDRSGAGFIPATRVGVYGPGGNLAPDDITHVNFFARNETADFLFNALAGRTQPLERIDTKKLLPDRRAARGMAVGAVPAAPSPIAPPAAPVAAVAGAPQAPPTSPRLRVTVTNGDLAYISEVLMIGHYRATRLTGTEDVMDRLIGGSMAHAIAVGLYPLAIGTHQFFINKRENREGGSVPKPSAVIVVGLEQEGSLQSADLVNTVRQAVIGWAQHLADGENPPASFELAATLIGSGGTGVTPGDSARLVAQGVCEANDRLTSRRVNNLKWPAVSHLNLVEMYLDRAAEAWRALHFEATTAQSRIEVPEKVQHGMGALPRTPDTGYRGTQYDFISVETRARREKESAATDDGNQNQKTQPGRKDNPELFYTLHTRRARSEIRAQGTQSGLVRDLVSAAASDQSNDVQIRRTLFNLLVPVELGPYVSGAAEIQLELDSGSAPIPWELLDSLDSGTANDKPWAIRTKLIRKLKLENFRDRTVDANSDDRVLVIGEPKAPAGYAQLPGARQEAVTVSNALKASRLGDDKVRLLAGETPGAAGPDARKVVNALFEHRWRIVHIAGHGQLTEDGRGGVVLSNDRFVGADEIRSLRVVPELVFVNCCHLASGDGRQLLDDRVGFASGVAVALIEIGVRCVIAAGWAVDDDGANVFAETFYQSLLAGRRFAEAVQDARVATWERNPSSNTWAAYQCYGDPDWTFYRSEGAVDAAAPREDPDNLAAPESLKLALQRIAARCRFQNVDLILQRKNIGELEKYFGQDWGADGSVAELFGEAFVEAGAVDSGIRWYEKAIAAPGGQSSLKACESLANAWARRGWELVDRADRARTDLADALRDKKPRPAKDRAAVRRALRRAERKLRGAEVSARRDIRKSLELLAKARAIESTAEREGLVGSAYKRLALIDVVMGRRGPAQRDLRQMKRWYERALKTGREAGAKDVYYAASNILVAELLLDTAGSRMRGSKGRRRRQARPALQALKAAREAVKVKTGPKADFWGFAAEIELDQYEAVAKGQLKSKKAALAKDYEKLYKRNKSVWRWSSVYDTACLVLGTYARRTTTSAANEHKAANDLLNQVRGYAHPEES